jgi:hypothetical protein
MGTSCLGFSIYSINEKKPDIPALHHGWYHHESNIIKMYAMYITLHEKLYDESIVHLL